MFVEIGNGGGFYTVCTITKWDGIAVVCQNLFLGQTVFNLHGQEDLPDFPHIADRCGIFVNQQHAPGQLLGNRACALGTAGCDEVSKGGTDDSFDAETLMLIEFGIFRGHNSRQEVRGHLVQGNRRAVLVLKAHAYNRIILIIDFRSASLVEIRFIPYRESFGKVSEVNGQDSYHEDGKDENPDHDPEHLRGTWLLHLDSPLLQKSSERSQERMAPRTSVLSRTLPLHRLAGAFPAACGLGVFRHVVLSLLSLTVYTVHILSNYIKVGRIFKMSFMC